MMRANSQCINVIDHYLKGLFTENSNIPKELAQSMEYSLFNGGKRLRPLFCLSAFKIYSEDIMSALPYACAVELIHTYSLIHDDLPAMDNDDYRRGKPTNHKVYGEDIAILAGDSLLNLATEVITKAILKYSDSEKISKGIRALDYIFRASGSTGMIAGQIEDIKDDNKISEEALRRMYLNKTAALIKAAVVSGAIMGGAGIEDIKNLEDFSQALGLYYQLQDDYLDREKDIKEGKVTILKYIGIDQIDEELYALQNRFNQAISKIDGNTKPLADLANSLVKRSF